MAHFWKEDDAGRWTATPVGDTPAFLNEALDLVQAAVDEATFRERVRLTRLGSSPERWAVLCPPQSELRVNGEPVPFGLAVLADRDELRLPGHPARFFSTETLAHVQSFPGSEADGCCPRCKLPIESGSPAVCCPACGLWHHQSADASPCWTYSSTCAGCAQDTSTDAGFRWTPEDL